MSSKQITDCIPSMHNSARVPQNSCTATLMALIILTICDLTLLFLKFPKLCWLVSHTPRRNAVKPGLMLPSVLASLANAQVWYLRNINCLQRSAALTILLRLSGIPSDFVVGCRRTPFYAHAWVEVAGVAILDDPAFIAELQVLDRI